MRGWPTAVLALVVTGCAAGRGPSPATGTARPEGEVSEELVPPGLGTLRQEEVTLTLRDGSLQVKVTPLAENVIRLLAPDTYERLHALAASRRMGNESWQTLFLVSFFSHDPDVTFTPEDLQIVHQGAILRPVSVQGVTSGFGRQRLQQQETQSAVYAFDERLNYELPITVRYRSSEASSWLEIQQRLERERSRVRARVPGRDPLSARES